MQYSVFFEQLEYQFVAPYSHHIRTQGSTVSQSDAGKVAATQFRASFVSKLAVALAVMFTASATAQDRTPESAVAALDVADGLEVKLFAAEPMLLSPSNIDVDHLGRIWVCEVVNYRKFANKDNPVREEGDRILVLEDTNGDGMADKETTFYQGRDIDSAHGVCVLGSRVIVSAGDSVINLYDDDGDLKADRKEVMFTGIQGVQHDHGIHSFLFGPDGRLYFNFGNNGKELHHADGSPVVDVAGNTVLANRKPYQEGMAFRCELDGTKIDTLGWNFRNNWELCVDSFGTIWQSDNDDDGNRGVRINFVMEYGNYGYKDEFTGAGWRDGRTNLEDEIPLRHWHLNDPGVVPNLLQTGAGSPTGILIYEGAALPDRFLNQLIHCDAGPNIVRSYAITDDGAGYRAEINDILEGARDQWFRPSDVCVAPDGSLIIADWYDPGVGGHRQGDPKRGRLFRVSLPGHKYTVPTQDFSTIAGAITALKSPNMATRYLAYQKLNESGAAAESALVKMYSDDPNPRFRARALWLLGQIDGKAQHYVELAIGDAKSDIRIAGLRLARRMELDVSPLVLTLSDDESIQVLRECAVALRSCESVQMPGLWARLATRYERGDRWFLESLGLAADGRWDECMAELAKSQSATQASELSPAVVDLIWRSRGSSSAYEIVSQIVRGAEAAQDGQKRQHVPTLFRALDFQPRMSVAAAVAPLLKKDLLDGLDDDVTSLVIAEALQRVGDSNFASNPDASLALERVLSDVAGTSQFVQLVKRFQLKEQYADVLAIAQQNTDQQVGIDAIVALLDLKQWNLITSSMHDPETKVGIATAEVLGTAADGRIGGPLLAVIGDPSADLSVRRAAVRAASRANNAAKDMVKLYDSGKLDPSLDQALAAALHTAPSRATRDEGQRLFPLPPSKDNTPIPPISKLAKLKGNIENGRLVFFTHGTCHKCHVVNDLGREIGPNLSEIGSKLSRAAMFESMLYPSAAISHNYEAWTVVLATGTTANGLLVSETDDAVRIKGDDALERTFQRDDIEEMIKQKISLMPTDVQKVMTTQELADVVEYMQSLRKKK
jgi:putative membrane-bound dehydrogenase-like protein